MQPKIMKNCEFFSSPSYYGMENFGNRKNFRLPVFGGFTRFGAWRIQKDTKLEWCTGVR